MAHLCTIEIKTWAKQLVTSMTFRKENILASLVYPGELEDKPSQRNLSYKRKTKKKKNK